MTPKVSIVVPVFNVERYLAECLDSIIRQTLRDIEIIIVNDGSTDSSLAIALDYASKDDRIVIIDKPNAGYGHSMNRGFEKALGEYIGIVESDDCARPDMFEKLYSQAVANNADVVRSNYFTMRSTDNGPVFNLIDILTLTRAPYCQAFNAQNHPEILRGSPAIWTGIYKKDYVFENGITFLESAGASYQDTGFMLKALTLASRVVLMREGFLNYRIDNENSSVKSGAKVFCVMDEYVSFEELLAEHPEKAEAFRFMVPAKKYETYLWNYNRLDEALKPGFLELMTREFSEAANKGNLDKALFSAIEWDELQTIINHPEELEGKSLSVASVELDPVEHRKTLRANGVISAAHYFAWRIKHAIAR